MPDLEYEVAQRLAAFRGDLPLVQDPVPPSEIRRRGSRARVRRLTVQGAVAAALAAVAVVPFVSLIGQDSEPVLAVPGSFNLQVNAPIGRFVPDKGVDELSPCDQILWPLASGGGRSFQARWTQPSGGQGRELIALDSAAEAEAVLEQIRAGVAACPEEVLGSNPEQSKELDWQLHEAPVADRNTITVSQIYPASWRGGSVLWQVTQVHNVVFVVESVADFDEESVAPVIAEVTAGSLAVLAELGPIEATD